MHLRYADWHEWAADGVTVQSFKATTDGSTITIRSGDRVLIDLAAPTKQSPWAESEPVTFEGRALVLVARRISWNTIMCDLFQDGLCLRTGRTLEQTRLIGVPKEVDAVSLGVTLVAAAPHVLVLGALRGMIPGVTLDNILPRALAVAFLFGCALVASWVGTQILAGIQRSGRFVGLWTGFVVASVLAGIAAAFWVLSATPLSVWMRG